MDSLPGYLEMGTIVRVRRIPDSEKVVPRFKLKTLGRKGVSLNMNHLQ